MEDSEIVTKAFVIGARETVRGFQLIGVPGKEARTATEILDILYDAINKDYALIILSASAAFRIENQLDEIRLDTPIPIFVISDVNLKVDVKDLEKKFRSFIGVR